MVKISSVTAADEEMKARIGTLVALTALFSIVLEVSAFSSFSPTKCFIGNIPIARCASQRTHALRMGQDTPIHDGQSRRNAILTAAACIATIAVPTTTTKAEEGANADICEMTTTAGTMKFEFWPEVAPKTVENFKTLAKSGYFDGQAFHRIIKGFVIQGGDPNSKKGYGPTGTLEGADVNAVRKWGTGGPGYNINAEFNPRKHEFGVLSMARSQDPNSAGSQFFVCLGNLASLDNKYTTFGRLIDGADVLRKLGEAQTVRGDYPAVRQGIEKVKILPAAAGK